MSAFKYLNTDLDVWSDRDLRPMEKALTSRGLFSLRPVEPGEGQWFAVFETDATHPAPDENLAEMLSAVESLTDRAAAVWAGCSLREFNIGYQCGDEPWAFNHGLSNDVLRRLAAAGATLRITLYPPEAGAAVRMPPSAEVPPP